MQTITADHAEATLAARPALRPTDTTRTNPATIAATANQDTQPAS
jgi:hypothetical protein